MADKPVARQVGASQSDLLTINGRLKWGGLSGTKTYYAWRSMRARCTNPKAPGFKNYGGRGIAVCERWRGDYLAFLADMGEAPEGMSLDRIDVEGDYEPGNCRWASNETQANNQRRNVLYEHDGLTMTIPQWARHLRIGVDTLWRRLNVYGMPLDVALTPGSLSPTWRHGTRQGYERGCKCRECKAAHAARIRERRRKKNADLGLVAETAREPLSGPVSGQPGFQHASAAPAPQGPSAGNPWSQP